MPRLKRVSDEVIEYRERSFWVYLGLVYWALAAAGALFGWVTGWFTGGGQHWFVGVGTGLTFGLLTVGACFTTHTRQVSFVLSRGVIIVQEIAMFGRERKEYSISDIVTTGRPGMVERGEIFIGTGLLVRFRDGQHLWLKILRRGDRKKLEEFLSPALENMRTEIARDE